MESLRALTQPLEERVSHQFEEIIDSLNGFDHPLVRRYIDWKIKGVEVAALPDYLNNESSCAILASNYPEDRWHVLKVVMKVASRLPGKKARIRAIGGKDMVENATWDLRALGVTHLIYPAIKTSKGKYTLEDEVKAQLESQLKLPGIVLWQSITGKTEGNGLLTKDIQPGAASWSATYQIPIFPMAIIPGNGRGNDRTTQVEFGSLIEPPDTEGLTSTSSKYELLIGHTLTVMYHIAKLLPPGQRGDFEDLNEWERRLNLTGFE